jgi:hypothetical protein
MSDFILEFKNLKPADWKKKVDADWTVKDVISHLVGWERESVLQLPKIWITKRKPWFLETDNYDEFNRRSIEQFSKLSTVELLQEWKYWSEKFLHELNQIPEAQLEEYAELYDWAIESGEDSHYAYHIRQIRDAIKK